MRRRGGVCTSRFSELVAKGEMWPWESLMILGRMRVSNWTRAVLECLKLFPYVLGAGGLSGLRDLRAADGEIRYPSAAPESGGVRSAWHNTSPFLET